MKLGKVFFTHLREVGLDGEFKATGGATLAWSIDENNGELRVAVPAICHKKDNFERRMGRCVAQYNYDQMPPLFILPKDYYMSMAKMGAIQHMQVPVMTKQGQDKLLEATLALLEEDIYTMMSSNWFESIIRDFIVFENNRLTVL